MNINNIGSFWNKWDLHLHSPYSNLANKYNCSVKDFCKTIKEKGLRVVGLTNYFIIHEHEYNEVVAELGDDVLVIPNVEFRTNDTNKDNEYINLHVLFNPEEIAIKDIISTLSRIKLNNIASATSVYCSAESINAIGFDKVTISIDQLVEQLKEDFHEKDYLVVGVPNGYGGFHPDNKPRSIQLAQKIDELCTMMFGRKEDSDFFLSTNNERAKLGFLPKPNFVCSDAHTIGDIGTKFTWVKSEPSFEGLKQILYEPKHRIDCNDNVRKPYRAIESIQFNLPQNTKLRNTHTNTEQSFCLNELRSEIFFSPYFTCIIGGRGSGKSTIINIIAEKLGEKTDFLQNNRIIAGGTDVLKANENGHVVIKGTNEIEFVSQGKVEKLSDGSQLTDLIFSERIKAIGNEYEEKEKELFAKFKILDECITITTDLEKLDSNLVSKRLLLENDKKIIASIENEKYKELSKKVESLSKEIEQIKNSKNKYGEFISSLVDLLMSADFKGATDEYALRVGEIINELENVEELTKIENGYSSALKSFPITDKDLEDKLSELTSLKKEIIEYFTSIGSTEDSIADVDRATSNVTLLSNEIAEIEKQIRFKREQISERSAQTSSITELASQCESIIVTRLEKINNDLTIENENVERIKFEYQFDKDKFIALLNKDFYEHFKGYHKQGLSWDNIYWCLKLIEPSNNFLNLTHKEYLESLAQKDYDKGTLYSKVFLEIFENKANFEIYQFLVKKHLYNISANVEIIGFYGNVPLSSCSFGQRCTAVVVTLLMTGMKPLLIDEPEAHLDNRLIAEYLVDLIKQKKNERQIIFATHNANFVINGDAELIHILDIPKGKVCTEITSTTIENLSHRKNLLKLEGGEEAFKKRDKKLLSSVKIKAGFSLNKMTIS